MGIPLGPKPSFPEELLQLPLKSMTVWALILGEQERAQYLSGEVQLVSGPALAERCLMTQAETEWLLCL